jgi:4-diphosphocytidyl-2-C-methyl-D-erythritol kinase
MHANNDDAPVTEIAYAKINLALHVLGRRSDGYHILDTIFAFLDTGDHLQAVSSDTLKLDITGPYAGFLPNDDNNLIIRAAHLMQNAFNTRKGAAFTLGKRLPVSSGIGGGSANAAAAARMLRKLWELPVTLEELAVLLAPLGADIPACVQSETVRGTQTGTELQSVDGDQITGLSALLVNPNIAVSTKDVFARWNGGGNIPLSGRGAAEMMASGRNDLQQPAMLLCPEIADILSALETQNTRITRMSGSGATCFALFDNNQDALNAEQHIKTSFPAYWTVIGKLR